MSDFDVARIPSSLPTGDQLKKMAKSDLLAKASILSRLSRKVPGNASRITEQLPQEIVKGMKPPKEFWKY